MKKLLKVTSLLMVFALLIQIMPMSTIAEAVTTPETEVSSAVVENEVLRERADLRDKFTKVFEREDGTYTAVVSATPIHFEEDSKWQDIDNTLVESTDSGQTVLKNTDNAYSISLPKSLTGNGEAVKIEKDGYTISYALNDVRPPLLKGRVDAKPEKDKTHENVSDVQKAAKLENKSAVVKYTGMQPDVDVEYTVLPDSVKENIILNKKPNGNKQFSFTIGAPGMTAKLLPDNTIDFYGIDGKPVFSLPAPFMFDTDDVYSEDIKVTFTQNSDGAYTLTYNPSEEWLQAKERVYPVVIDPVVKIAIDEEDTYDKIYDTYVTNASGENHSHGFATTTITGNKSEGSYWSYFRPVTTLWASKAIVTNATLKVYAKSETASSMTLAAYTVTSNWFEQVTFSGKPTTDALPIDYAVAPVNEYGQITFDITKAFPRNQDNLNAATYPRGVMLGAYDSTVNSAVIYTSEYTNTACTPIIEYSYVETTGLSDKYEYHTHSAGRAGTVSINDFTGGMFIERDELGIDGNIMPVNIKQYYSTATADLANGCTSYCLNSYNDFEDYGRVWLTNYHRFVGFADDIFVDENGNTVDMYLYIDGTGAITYFVLDETVNGVEKWVEQYDKTSLPKGFTLTVPATESGGDDFSEVIIEEPSGEKLAFDFAGRMVSITAAENEHVTTAPQIEITYKAINQYKFYEIEKIADGVGREYRFTYNTVGRLTAMQAYDAQSAAIKVGIAPNDVDLKITYAYEGDGTTSPTLGRLTSATYPDGETVNYTYVSTHPGAPLIESITDINGYRLAYTYDSKLAVTQIEESALDSSSTRVTGNVVDLTYDSMYQRTYEDSYDNVEVAQFDNYGRKIGTYNDEEQYKRTTYEDTVIDSETYNLLSGSSYVQAQNDNLILNPSFESGTSSWTVIQGSSYSPGVDSTIKNTGSNSYKMNCTSNGTIGVNQSFTNLAAGTYTFSAYVNVPNAVNTGDDGAKISIETKNSGGTIVEHLSSGYVKNTGGIWQRISINIEVTASTPTVNVYLWLYNSTGIAYFDNAKLEKCDLETPYNVLLNSKMSSVTNNMPNSWTGTNLTSSDVADSQTKFEDTVNVMKITGSPTTQKSISQSFSIAGGAGDIVDIGCWAKANAASNSNAEFRMRATYSYTDTNNQTVNVTESLDFIPYADYWQFVADSFTLLGTCSVITIYLDYDYQINTAYFTDVRVAYTDVSTGGAASQEDDTPTYCVCGEENCAYGLGCDCPCESEVACTCLQCHETTAYAYDSMGNITSTTTDNGTKEMVTANAYTADKNYLASTTNSTGNMVQYGYNTGNGTLTSVTDSLNKTVNYTYNAMRALAGVSQTVSNLTTGSALTNSYEYVDDRLTGITAGNTVDYSFDYDLWGYQTEVSVGTQSLAEYTYGTGENCGRVASVTFGNGQTITFSYDSYNNVTGISYDGGTTYSYTYTYSSANGLTSVTDNISDQITYFTDTGYEVYTIPQTGQGVLLYSSGYDDDDNFVQTANGYSYTFADGTAETPDETTARRTTGLTVKRSTISSTGTSLALSTSADFFGRPVNSTLGVKDGANSLGSVAVDYTYQNGTGDRTTEYISSYKNVVTPTTGSATNVEYTYTYDANGNIVSDSLGGTLKHSYVYDEAGQLVRVNDAVQNKTFCYTYDNGGNLIYKKRYAYTTGTLGSVLQTMATYAYGDSNWKDRLTSFNSIPLSYDAIGNLTYFDGRTFSWTAGRQLAGFELNTDDYAVTYKYNADGLRTQKYIDDDQTYTQTTYDYIWADGRLVSQTDGTDVLYFLYNSSDSPIGFVLNDSATYLYIKNLQGDITGIADENGAIIVNYTYDEWGKLLSLTDNSLDGIIGELNPLRYRGYYYDTETGYYYLQSRYYNPSWGRFINADVYVDTRKFSMGSNMFAYCENNSINMSDPTGLFKKNFHYDRTKIIAIDALFKEKYAEAIAFGCNDIDKRFSPIHRSAYQQSWHFNVNMIWDKKTLKLIANPNLPDSRDTRGESAMRIAKDFLSSANRFGANSYERNRELLEAFYWFGAYLHTQQDKVSHSGDYGNMAVLVGSKPLFFFHSTWGGIDDMDREYLDSGYTTGVVATFITALAMVGFKLSIKREFPSVYKEILR